MPNTPSIHIPHRSFLGLVILASIALALVPSTRAAVLADEAVHLIICPAAFQTQFEALADHRTDVAGVASCVVTLEEILSTAPTGRDDAETLRNYLIQQYALGNLRYVLLGGDSDFMPVRLARSTWYPQGGFSDLESDLYYACLDGDWDANGNSIFGEAYKAFDDPGDEVDLDPELAVGRAPVDDAAQTQRFVEGVIGYDKENPAPYLASAAMLAEVLFPSNWTGGAPDLDGAYYAESYGASLQSHPSPPGLTRLYENWTAYPGSSALTTASALDALGPGNQGLLCFIGNGTLNSFSVGGGSVTSSDMDGLTNAPRYHLTLTLSSDAASFLDDCILEHLVLAPHGGSAGALGSTDVVFSATSDDYLEAFFQQISASSGVLLGDAMQSVLKSKAPTGLAMESFNRWTSFTWCLLGDPATPFRTELRPVPTEPKSVGGFKSLFRER